MYARIEEIIETLNKQNFAPRIIRVPIFYDEPRFFFYNTQLSPVKKFFKNYNTIRVSPGSGFSMFSAEEALITSLCEAVERFCLVCYSDSSIIRAKYKDNPSNFVNPSDFTSRKDIENIKLGWVEGTDFISGRKILIPAHLAYLNFEHKKPSDFTFPRISTGAAAGETEEQALLNGIYEAVERDAFMCTYLNSITPPRVKLENVKSKFIRAILEKCRRYKLELYVLDATTDIGIPSYISVIIDRTGLGPAVVVGSRCGLRAVSIIEKAITEVFMGRAIAKGMMRNEATGGSTPEDDVFFERGSKWFDTSMIKNISFLISSKKISKIKDFKGTRREELDEVHKILKKRNLPVYFADISFKPLATLGLKVYKVIIPGVQPLYLHEAEKYRALNMKRLAKVAEYAGVSGTSLNSVPHPFL